MSVTCPRCEVENRDEAKRCMACNTDLSRGRFQSGPQATAARLCPAGRHPMDPSWAVCNYCKAEEEAKPAGVPPTLPGGAMRRATVMESSQARPASPPPPAGPPPVGPPPPPAVASSQRRRTAFMPSFGLSSAPVSGAAQPTGRRIVALLVTYSWHSEGQVFPVREGRNDLGSDPDCDVAVDRDPQLSGRHATILYRGRGFWIDDEKSMNGTFVDGECVEEKQRICNYAEIRTGSTVWRFVEVEPSGVSSPATNT